MMNRQKKYIRTAAEDARRITTGGGFARKGIKEKRGKIMWNNRALKRINST